MEKECCYWVPISSCDAFLEDMRFNTNFQGRVILLKSFPLLILLFILSPSEELQNPTLGPIYLHFYLKEEPYRYFGRLLISVESETAHAMVMQTLTPSLMSPLNEDNYWSTPTFNLNFVLLEMNCLPIRIEKIIMHISCGGTFLSLYALKKIHDLTQSPLNRM